MKTLARAIVVAAGIMTGFSAAALADSDGVRQSAFVRGFASAFNAQAGRCHYPGIPDTYDSDFRAAARTYWSAGRTAEWCRLKARAQVESSFREDAVSPAGATCLLQVMPATAGDFGVSVTELYVSKVCISTGARVSERYWNVWITDRPHRERWKNETASYNAGPGHIIEAQKLCGMARDWDDIKLCLPQVTGHHAQETINYVERNEFWLARLQGRAQ